MAAKVLALPVGRQVEQSPVTDPRERELERQKAASDRLAARICSVPDGYPTFPPGCRWVGHEPDSN